MPLIPTSSYQQAPFGYYSGHLQTILPLFFRKTSTLPYQRERLELKDGDFLDLDWIKEQNNRLVILSHGLGGNSQSSYVKAGAQYFSKHQYDVLAWNCRGCSGEPNRKLRAYHHGEIKDIEAVISHAIKAKGYKEVYLMGYSMGGSITLKYLGVNAHKLPKEIKSAVSFSAPPLVKICAKHIDKPENYFYKQNFLQCLLDRVAAKAKQFPKKINIKKVKKIKTWTDFDRYFTAPINGFKNLKTFYYQASFYNYIIPVNIPVLAVNALNDPIVVLPKKFIQLSQMHPNIFLETPEQGGHVGFTIPNAEYSWMEQRAMDFFRGDRLGKTKNNSRKAYGRFKFEWGKRGGKQTSM